MNSIQVGQQTEALVIAKLVSLGYICSIPFGSSAVYDLVVDKDGKLYRVQVKHARVKNGCVEFNNYSVRYGKMTKYSVNDFDAFVVYCGETSQYFWVDVENVLPNRIKLRVEPKKKEGRESRFADRFELV